MNIDMKNSSHTTICGWMINELGLSGNELLCYALIYGFSQDGESCFSGSRKYIAEVIGAKSLNTVDKNLTTLIERGLILKESVTTNGIIMNTYRANLEIHYFKKCTPPSNFEQGYSKNEHNNNSNNDSYYCKEEEKKEIDKSISKKNKKKVFNVREDLSYVDMHIAPIWNEWLDYKDQIGKQYKTQRGAVMQYKSLMKYCDYSDILARAIVCRSIEHSWDGLFSITDKQKEFFLSSQSPYIDDIPKAHPKIKDGAINSKGEIWSEQLQKWLK